MQTDLGLNLTTKRTRKRELLDDMERVMPWQPLSDLITPYAPNGKHGRPSFPVETMILRCRRMLEEHKLAPQILAVVNELLQGKGLMLRADTVVDVALISAPSSTKNASGERAPQTKQSQKCKQWYFRMKAHIGVDADSGQLTNQSERIKASFRAEGEEHPFRVIKRQFGHVKVRYRGLAKNTAQLHTLFALSNLWMARRSLMGAQG